MNLNHLFRPTHRNKTKIIFHKLLTTIICLSLAISPLYAADQLSLPTSDLIAPEVVHTPETAPVKEGSSKTIRATVTDNVGIQTVILFYRIKGEANYNRRNMNLMENSNDYTVTIDNVAAPGIEYYIQATDTAGNTLLNGYEFSPLEIAVKPEFVETPTAAIATTDTDSAPTIETTENTVDLAKKPEEDSNLKWLWIGLGVLAVAALAGGGGSGGDDPQPENPTIIDITAPSPQ